MQPPQQCLISALTASITVIFSTAVADTGDHTMRVVLAGSILYAHADVVLPVHVESEEQDSEKKDFARFKNSS